MRLPLKTSCRTPLSILLRIPLRIYLGILLKNLCGIPLSTPSLKPSSFYSLFLILELFSILLLIPLWFVLESNSRSLSLYISGSFAGISPKDHSSISLDPCLHNFCILIQIINKIPCGILLRIPVQTPIRIPPKTMLWSPPPSLLKILLLTFISVFDVFHH